MIVTIDYVMAVITDPVSPIFAKTIGLTIAASRFALLITLPLTFLYRREVKRDKKQSSAFECNHK